MIGFQRGFDFTTVDLMPAAESSGQSTQLRLGISHIIQPPCHSLGLGWVTHLTHAWLASAKNSMYDFWRRLFGVAAWVWGLWACWAIGTAIKPNAGTEAWQVVLAQQLGNVTHNKAAA